MGRSRVPIKKMGKGKIMPKLYRNTKKTKNENLFLTNKDIFQSINNRACSESNGCTVIVPHVCDNASLFNTGFAKLISEKFPIVKENFHILGNTAKLGTNQYISVYKNKKNHNEIIFCNMICQNKTFSTNNIRPLNYAALVYSMVELKHYIAKYRKIQENIPIEIHCPKFGTGISGGEWRFIEELIYDTWKDFNVFVYVPDRD